MTLDPVDSGIEGVRLLHPTGDLDVTRAPALLEDVQALVRGATGLVVDLSDVTFFDSAGVRLVDRLARECDRAGAAFRIVAPPGSRCRRLLELVGMAGPMTSDDRTAAIDAVRPSGEHRLP